MSSGGLGGGVDEQPPFDAGGGRRRREFLRFGTAMEHHQHGADGRVGEAAGAKDAGEARAGRAPVDGCAIGVEPAHVRQLVRLRGFAGQESARGGRLAAGGGTRSAPCTKRSSSAFRSTSFQSNQVIGVVLAIGVVVAALRAAALRRPSSSIGTPWLKSSVASMFLICRRRSVSIACAPRGPFDAVVVAVVVVVAVAVAFAVGLVVLVARSSPGR